MRKLILGLTLVFVLVLALVALPACGDDGKAELEVTGLSLSPSSAGIGETVTISVTVKNTGDEEGDTDVTVEVAGTEVGSKSVTVAAGGTGTATFSYTTTAAGTYTVVADGQTKTLTVTAGPAVTYVTRSTPIGFSFETPDDWVEVAYEDAMIGGNRAPDTIEGAATAGIDIVGVASFQAPTSVADIYPSVISYGYSLPMPFAPMAWYGMQTEPKEEYDGKSTFEMLYPEYTEVSYLDTRTATTQDRVCCIATFTWRICDEWTAEEVEPRECLDWGLNMKGMFLMVQQGGVLYTVECQTTAETFSQYEAIFEHMCMSATVP